MPVGFQPASMGDLRYVHQRWADLARQYVRDDTAGHYRPERAHLLLQNKRTGPPMQQRLLTWLREHVHPNIPRLWYEAVLGHDLHVSTYAELYLQHYHATLPDPFTGRIGWLENVGLVSRGKVTTAFAEFEIDNLVTDSTAYGDYKYHEVGTSTAAETSTQTALTTTSGIARVAGTQTEASSLVYQSVAAVTADASETWTEHGIFNTSGTAPTMMDRSLISPTVAVVSLDVVTFTYQITKAAEA